MRFNEAEMVSISGEKPLPKSLQPMQPNQKPFVPKPYDETRDPLLATRQQTHGNFADNAKVSQGMKEWLRTSPGWVNLTDVEREAMDMIALKFSRILSGKSLEKQHWEDVVGYAKLVEEICK